MCIRIREPERRAQGSACQTDMSRVKAYATFPATTLTRRRRHGRITGVGLPAFILAFGAVVVTAQSQQTPQQGARAPQPPRLRLASPAFRDGASLPLQFTCYAEGVSPGSPPLQWTNAPKDAASFTLMVNGTDNHPAKGITEEMFWVLWNLPPRQQTSRRRCPLVQRCRMAAIRSPADAASWAIDRRALPRVSVHFTINSSCMHSIRC